MCLNNLNDEKLKMNFIFLLLFFLFLSLRSDAKPKCRSYPFKTLLSPKNCRCNNITHSPMGRIFNGTDLDSRDLPYVVPIYSVKAVYCTGTIISPRFVLT